MKKARFAGIPCWYDPNTCEIKGRNLLWDILLSAAIFLHVGLLLGDFPIEIEDE